MKQFRTTKQNQLILSVVQSHCNHSSADQIYLEVRKIDDKISRGTVYRNLDKLVKTGDLLHIKVPGADRFDSRLDFHYHMICTKCNAVFDAPLEYLREIDKQTDEKTEFHIHRHRLFFEGICKDCLKKEQN